MKQRNVMAAIFEMVMSCRLDNGGCSVLPIISFSFLALNSAAAIYRTLDDPLSVSFVVLSFLDLTWLFTCIHLLEQTPRHNSGRRGQLKFAAWVLSAVLTIMFAYRVAGLMPVPVAVLVWSTALITLGDGFYAFLIYKEEDGVRYGMDWMRLP